MYIPETDELIWRDMSDIDEAGDDSVEGVVGERTEVSGRYC
jgi:hypothetical protein